MGSWLPFGMVVIFGLFLFSRWINILNEYERAVVFRLGRILKRPKGPGLVLILWPIDKMVKISLRTVVHDVPSQDVITRDNVSVKVNAVVYFRVVDPIKAVIEVENYLFADRRIQAARFPMLKTIDSFDFASQKSVNEPLIRELLRCEFIDHHENVLLIAVTISPVAAPM